MDCSSSEVVVTCYSMKLTFQILNAGQASWSEAAESVHNSVLQIYQNSGCWQPGMYVLAGCDTSLVISDLHNELLRCTFLFEHPLNELI